MRLTKRAIYQSEQSTLRSSLDMVSSFMGIVTELDDYRTRTAALVERLNKNRIKMIKRGTEAFGFTVPRNFHGGLLTLLYEKESVW